MNQNNILDVGISMFELENIKKIKINRIKKIQIGTSYFFVWKRDEDNKIVPHLL